MAQNAWETHSLAVSILSCIKMPSSAIRFHRDMNTLQQHNIRYYQTSPSAISSAEWLFWCLPDNPLESDRCDGATVRSQLSLEWHTHTDHSSRMWVLPRFKPDPMQCVCACEVLEEIQSGNMFWAKQMLWNGRWDQSWENEHIFHFNHILSVKYTYSDKSLMEETDTILSLMLILFYTVCTKVNLKR